MYRARAGVKNDVISVQFILMYHFLLRILFFGGVCNLPVTSDREKVCRARRKPSKQGEGYLAIVESLCGQQRCYVRFFEGQQVKTLPDKAAFSLLEVLPSTNYLFSHCWLATPQDVLQADWQEVWHSPQPPLFTVFTISFVSTVLILFMTLSSVNISQFDLYTFTLLFYHKDTLLSSTI